MPAGVGWKKYAAENVALLNRELSARGLSVQKVSKDLGINYGLMTNIVKGQYAPGVTLAEALAEYLGLSYVDGLLSKPH